MSKKTVYTIGIIVIIIIAISLLKSDFTSASTKAIDSGDSIKIPADQITKNAEFFSYENNRVDIEYFIVKASDGKIKTAINACDLCYSSKKGYRQEENHMVCNNCGNKYSIIGLGTQNKAGGGCWPGYLPNTIQDGYITIKKIDLEKQRYRFV